MQKNKKNIRVKIQKLEYFTNLNKDNVINLIKIKKERIYIISYNEILIIYITFFMNYLRQYSKQNRKMALESKLFKIPIE